MEREEREYREERKKKLEWNGSWNGRAEGQDIGDGMEGEERLRREGKSGIRRNADVKGKAMEQEEDKEGGRKECYTWNVEGEMREGWNRGQEKKGKRKT